jgi:hypothetical protein
VGVEVEVVEEVEAVEEVEVVEARNSIENERFNSSTSEEGLPCKAAEGDYQNGILTATSIKAKCSWNERSSCIELSKPDFKIERDANWRI